MQILKDNPKARREINLHWQASTCPQIVPIIDVYENVIDNQRCLLVVMEWCVQRPVFIVQYCTLIATESRRDETHVAYSYSTVQYTVLVRIPLYCTSVLHYLSVQYTYDLRVCILVVYCTVQVQYSYALECRSSSNSSFTCVQSLCLHLYLCLCLCLCARTRMCGVRIHSLKSFRFVPFAMNAFLLVYVQHGGRRAVQPHSAARRPAVHRARCVFPASCVPPPPRALTLALAGESFRTCALELFLFPPSLVNRSSEAPHFLLTRTSLFLSPLMQKLPRLCSRSPPPFASFIKTLLHIAISSQRTYSIPKADPTVRSHIYLLKIYLLKYCKHFADCLTD